MYKTGRYEPPESAIVGPSEGQMQAQSSLPWQCVTQIIPGSFAFNGNEFTRHRLYAGGKVGNLTDDENIRTNYLSAVR